MTMTIALDVSDRVVSIDEVPSGRACMCRCVECQEPVIARKGTQRTHHFSHLSQKVPCEVQPESFLHRYAKRVVMEAGGLHLPPMPGHEPDSEDTSSWWDFISVYEEVWLGSFRPDLVAQLPDGVLLIEFACTSFVDEEKLARIARQGSRAVEVDLRGLQVSASAAGLEVLKQDILHRADIKQWLHPALPKPELANEPSVDVVLPNCGEKAEPVSERGRLTIQGMWVDYRVLAYGSVVVRSVSFNPTIAALLKRLARQYGGHYVPQYRNWLFPSWAKAMLLGELVSLSDTPLSDAQAG